MMRPPRLTHGAERGLVGVERALHVDVEDQIPLVVRDVFGRRAPLDAGDVGHHVEAAELGDGALEHVEHLAAIGDVAGMNAALRAGVAGDALAIGIVDVDRDDAGALGDVGPNRGRADAAGAAGDDCALLLQQHRRI